MCLFQIEEKCSGLARENNELKSQIEEDEEEMKNLLQKNKTLVAQVNWTLYLYWIVVNSSRSWRATEESEFHHKA